MFLFLVSTLGFDDKLPQKHVGDDSFGKFGNPISTRGHVEGDSSDGRFLEHSYHAKAPITRAHGSPPPSLGNTQKRSSKVRRKKHKSIIRGGFLLGGEDRARTTHEREYVESYTKSRCRYHPPSLLNPFVSLIHKTLPPSVG
jgi:hypothetical protein